MAVSIYRDLIRARVETAPRLRVLQKALLAVDIAIANLKKQIKDGTANKQIMNLQLADLLEKQNALIKEIMALNQRNDPPPEEKAKE